MYVYMYVCIYVCTYVRMYVYICVYVFTLGVTMIGYAVRLMGGSNVVPHQSCGGHGKP